MLWLGNMCFSGTLAADLWRNKITSGHKIKRQTVGREMGGSKEIKTFFPMIISRRCIQSAHLQSLIGLKCCCEIGLCEIRSLANLSMVFMLGICTACAATPSWLIHTSSYSNSIWMVDPMGSWCCCDGFWYWCCLVDPDKFRPPY